MSLLSKSNQLDVQKPYTASIVLFNCVYLQKAKWSLWGSSNVINILNLFEKFEYLS